MNLTVKDLSKSFGEKQIFNGFSYSFSDVGLYIIKGDSGVGKTTLLRIISGIDKEYVGCVFGGGIKNVSFSFQEYRLFPQLNVIENLTETVYKKATSYDIMKAINVLSDLGFSKDDFKLYPNELSGGMKQRVGIIRALVMHPAVILMDEPFGALDAQTRNIMQDQLTKIIMHSERTIIFITHSVDEALYLSDRVVMLSKRPAKVKEIIEVPWERPRDRASPEFTALRKRILTELEKENVMEN